MDAASDALAIKPFDLLSTLSLEDEELRRQIHSGELMRFCHALEAAKKMLHLGSHSVYGHDVYIRERHGVTTPAIRGLGLHKRADIELDLVFRKPESLKPGLRAAEVVKLAGDDPNDRAAMEAFLDAVAVDLRPFLGKRIFIEPDEPEVKMPGEEGEEDDDASTVTPPVILDPSDELSLRYDADFASPFGGRLLVPVAVFPMIEGVAEPEVRLEYLNHPTRPPTFLPLESEPEEQAEAKVAAALLLKRFKHDSMPLLRSSHIVMNVDESTQVIAVDFSAPTWVGRVRKIVISTLEGLVKGYKNTAQPTVYRRDFKRDDELMVSVGRELQELLASVKSGSGREM